MTVQSEASVRNASITAGVGLLLMSVLSGFGNFVGVVGLVTRGMRHKQPRTSRGPRACSSSVS